MGPAGGAVAERPSTDEAGARRPRLVPPPELAAKRPGADVVNVPASSSSVTKGESLLDTAHTLRALGADVLVMRHAEAGAPYVVARHVPCMVLNAGDGWHAHPTQALLDLYTLRERLGSIAGRRIVIVGD